MNTQKAVEVTGEGNAPRVAANDCSHSGCSNVAAIWDGTASVGYCTEHTPREFPVRMSCELVAYYQRCEAQRDELLAWKEAAIATSERQLQAFQEMQAIAQRKESVIRELLAAFKEIAEVAYADETQYVRIARAAIAKAEGRGGANDIA